MAASTPVSREVSRVRRCSTVSPAAMSVPAKLMALPGATARCTSMPPSRGMVCSTITTASAPRGITPPVAMGVAMPARTSIRGTTLVWITSSVSRRKTGSVSSAPKVSSARTAKPSTLLRSK